MSINVPQKFSKSDFNKLIDKTLKTDEMQQFIRIFKENYKRSNDRLNYELKEHVTEQAKEIIDYVLKRIEYSNFESLDDVAEYLRMHFDYKKFVIMFAYNGTGKTRLSTLFKSLGQTEDTDSGKKTSDTLYYNAFTEDLFFWDNDLENDAKRVLKFNSASMFFVGLEQLDMESKIRPFLHTYADFDFSIDYTDHHITFSRNILRKQLNNTTGIEEDRSQVLENIKVSRGEQNIFIWCFFLAIIQLVIDGAEAYSWVKYIYIDDPISSLDDNNVIAVACNMAKLLNEKDNVKTIISTHHALFFNVICNELSSSDKYFLQKSSDKKKYILKDTSKTPLFQHAAMLKGLNRIVKTGEIYAYHFNVLRSIIEKTASFHGFNHFSACLKKEGELKDDVIYKRALQLLSHGNYSLFEPREMIEENKKLFKDILDAFLENYKFNDKLFEDSQDLEEN